MAEHFRDLLAATHAESGSAKGEDGACLEGHVGAYKDSNTCSYRWQAFMAYSAGGGTGHVDGRDNRYITPVVSAAIRSARTSRYVTSATRDSANKKYVPPSSKYPATLPAPREGAAGAKDWAVLGPATDWEVKDANGTTLYTVKAEQNFRGKGNESTWPYWNNAHHIIPKATLREAISKVPDPAGWKGAFPVKVAIEKFLLKQKYNVNHHKNVIFLPMDKEVGKILGLPRHLVLEDDTSLSALDERGSPEISPKFNHLNYNNLADSRLTEIMDDFAKAAKKAVEEDACVTKEMNAAKEKLEQLSDDLHEAILVQGALKQGDPISLLTDVDLAQASQR